jgi:holo-[acyl-carrier protein] synthase
LLRLSGVIYPELNIRGVGFLRLIGVGVDIVDIEVFKSRLDDGMIEHLYLPREIEYCSGRARPWESYAARFAAKEAVFKALGAGLSQGMRWRDVEVLKGDSGEVTVRLHGKALEEADVKGVSSVCLSMSHTGISAIAIVVMQA